MLVKVKINCYSEIVPTFAEQGLLREVDYRIIPVSSLEYFFLETLSEAATVSFNRQFQGCIYANSYTTSKSGTSASRDIL